MAASSADPREEVFAAFRQKFSADVSEEALQRLDQLYLGTVHRNLVEGVIQWEEPARTYLLNWAANLGQRLQGMAEDGVVHPDHVDAAADEIIEEATTQLASPLCPAWREYQV